MEFGGVKKNFLLEYDGIWDPLIFRAIKGAVVDAMFGVIDVDGDGVVVEGREAPVGDIKSAIDLDFLNVFFGHGGELEGQRRRWFLVGRGVIILVVVGVVFGGGGVVVVVVVGVVFGGGGVVVVVVVLGGRFVGVCGGFEMCSIIKKR